MARVFTEADKIKQGEILRKAREEKQAEKVSVTIDKNFTIESYEYGWTVDVESNGNDKKFFCTLAEACKYILECKLKKSAARSLEELVTKVEALFDFKEFLKTKVTF